MTCVKLVWIGQVPQSLVALIIYCTKEQFDDALVQLKIK